MRRDSDHAFGTRTGTGRRSRDRRLGGATPTINAITRELPALRGPVGFLAEDLRESAIAAAALESFLDRAEAALAAPAPDPAELAALGAEDMSAKLELLADAVASVQATLRRVASALPLQRPKTP